MNVGKIPLVFDGVSAFTTSMAEHATNSELPSELSHTELAAKLRDTDKPDDALLQAAADQLERLARLTTLLGMLAPGGTAPRTALEQIYAQSADPASNPESPIVLDLRKMLQEHWADWTPALREAEGLPPAPDLHIA